MHGKLQDAKGGLTDDPSDDLKGKARQAEGKVQEAWVRSKDAACKAVDEAV